MGGDKTKVEPVSLRQIPYQSGLSVGGAGDGIKARRARALASERQATSSTDHKSARPKQKIVSLLVIPVVIVALLSCGIATWVFVKLEDDAQNTARAMFDDASQEYMRAFVHKVEAYATELEMMSTYIAIHFGLVPVSNFEVLMPKVVNESNVIAAAWAVAVPAHSLEIAEASISSTAPGSVKVHGTNNTHYIPRYSASWNYPVATRWPKTSKLRLGLDMLQTPHDWGIPEAFHDARQTASITFSRRVKIGTHLSPSESFFFAVMPIFTANETAVDIVDRYAVPNANARSTWPLYGYSIIMFPAIQRWVDIVRSDENIEVLVIDVSPRTMPDAPCIDGEVIASTNDDIFRVFNCHTDTSAACSRLDSARFVSKTSLNIAGRNLQILAASTSDYNKSGQPAIVLALCLTVGALLASTVAIFIYHHMWRKDSERKLERDIWLQGEVSVARVKEAVTNSMDLTCKGLRKHIISARDSVARLELLSHSNPEVRCDLNIARISTDRMKFLVDNVYDIGQLQSKLPIISAQYLSVEDLVKDLYSHFKRISKVPIIIRVSGTVPPMVEQDHDTVREILYHALNNACQFTESGTISLAISCSVDYTFGPGRLRFDITDTGCGLSPEMDTGKAFQAFTTGVDDPPTKKLGHGCGLGLFIAYHLARRIEAEVTLERAGMSARFVLSMPLKPIATSSAMVRPSKLAATRNHDSKAESRVSSTSASTGGVTASDLAGLLIFTIGEVEDVDVVQRELSALGCVSQSFPSVDACIPAMDKRVDAILLSKTDRDVATDVDALRACGVACPIVLLATEMEAPELDRALQVQALLLRPVVSATLYNTLHSVLDRPSPTVTAFTAATKSTRSSPYSASHP